MSEQPDKTDNEMSASEKNSAGQNGAAPYEKGNVAADSTTEGTVSDSGHSCASSASADEDTSRVGVYICYCGGNISDHVDVEAVRDEVSQLPNVTVARTNMFMCSDPGQALIIDDLKEKRVDRVVVASCAPSLHEATFRSAIERAGANPYIYDHANIREQVSWVHHGDTATKKAATLVAASAAKAELLEPLEPVRVDAFKHVTVIGGGISGMTAALNIAQNGMGVTLVEKEDRLGGRLNQLGRLAPTGEAAAGIRDTLVREIENHGDITVFTQAQIIDVQGYVGNFSLSLTVDGTQETLETGAVVMATGTRSYEPPRGMMGYQDHREVITLSALIDHLKADPHAQEGIRITDHQRDRAAGRLMRFNGRPVRSVAMIHCVGSRQIPGVHDPDEEGNLNEYCSRTCCSAMLQASVTMAKAFPATRVYEMYRDIRTYGRAQETLYHDAARNQVMFMRFEAGQEPEVTAAQTGGEDADFPLSVRVRDTLTYGEKIEVPVDLVVLATGVKPHDVSELVRAMKLPVGSDGFLLEVHPKLRPVEFPVSGVFLAGACQAPMDTSEACNAAGAAAAKASALLGSGVIELPPFVAEVNDSACTACGACVEACIKEGALTLVEKKDGDTLRKTACVAAAVCLGCGACAAVCEAGAIDLNGWSLKQYEKMVDAIVGDGRAA